MGVIYVQLGAQTTGRPTWRQSRDPHREIPGSPISRSPVVRAAALTLTATVTAYIPRTETVSTVLVIWPFGRTAQWVCRPHRPYYNIILFSLVNNLTYYSNLDHRVNGLSITLLYLRQLLNRRL